MVTIKQISSKKDKKKFFKFYIDLYRGNKYAAPNLYADEFAEFDPEVNDAFRFAECKMFLAYRGRKIVGRVAGIWHRGANAKTGLKRLRFTRFDVIDDFEVTKALFDALYQWADELGMDEIIGPMSFSDLNEEGMLVDGFDKPSTYIGIYNYPYYVKHMEKLGAYKSVEWNGFYIKAPTEPDLRLRRISEEVANRYGYSMVDVGYLWKHDKKKLDGYVMQCMDILDEAFENLFETSPLSEKQKRREQKTVYQVLVPEFAAIVLKDDKVVGYGMMIPSMAEVMRKARGSLIPRGIIPYIKAMKHPEVVDLLSIGIRPGENNQGIAALILNHCQEGILKHKVKYLEAGPELEYNKNVQNLWKNFDILYTKTWRCWGIKVHPENEAAAEVPAVEAEAPATEAPATEAEAVSNEN